MLPSPLARVAESLDSRIGRRAERPSLWPVGFGALISHAAIVAFGVLTVTGLALAVAYRPATGLVTYSGSSELYDGQLLPHAFASIVRISEDLPGGLLLRRVHVAASHIFLLSLVAHLLRVLATGAFRRPRIGTHLVGVGLLVIAILFAYTGELMPFSLVAASSLRILEAVVSSVPLIGEPLAEIITGGQLPSDRVLIGAWALHVILLPGAFTALLGWHLWLVHRRTPALERRPDVDVARRGVGRPLWPDAIARFALLTAGLTTLLVASAVVVPWADIELEGPFYAAEATNSVHPAWVMFFTTGALRVFPPIDVVLLGMRITNVLVAAAIVPTILIGMVVAYPFLERRLLGDRAEHHALDHPLDVPLRAGVVTFMTTVGVLLTAAAGVDVLSSWTGVPVEEVVTTFRITLVVLPLLLTAGAVALSRRRVARFAALEEDPTVHTSPPAEGDR
ncbi:MAG: cytochrome b N-terminal domain-containing protein [Nitriliruptor sp.]